MSKNKFMYGNYHNYYGYRNKGGNRDEDPRLDVMDAEWFKSKHVLDIGCNSGHVTYLVAKKFEPKLIIGVDIDPDLVDKAYKEVKYYLDEDAEDFPDSVFDTFGPLPPKISTKDGGECEGGHSFPYNIYFMCANFVEYDEDAINMMDAEYDVILALSITKWIHFNWGDAGIKRLFRRCHKVLIKGGSLILEVQSFDTYHKKAKNNEIFKENVKNLQLKPENFEEYLLKNVGFDTIDNLGVSDNESKGFKRNIFRCIK